MPEPKRIVRAEAALDDVSEHLGVVLRRADDLLAEWSSFGAAVREQVQREASTIGDAVAHAVDGAVARATVGGIDRTMTEHLGARLTALTEEISRLEGRARAASRSLADQRVGDRRVLWIVGAGVLVANALLVVLLLRRPPVAAAPVPAAPARIDPAPADLPPEHPSVPESAAGATEPTATPDDDAAGAVKSAPSDGAEPGIHGAADPAKGSAADSAKGTVAAPAKGAGASSGAHGAPGKGTGTAAHGAGEPTGAAAAPAASPDPASSAPAEPGSRAHPAAKPPTRVLPRKK